MGHADHLFHGFPHEHSARSLLTLDCPRPAASNRTKRFLQPGNVIRCLWGIAMSDAYRIETSRRTAGIAVYDEGLYRFFAADPLFSAMDGRYYNSVTDVERAATQYEQTSKEHRISRRQDSRGEVFRSWGRVDITRHMA
jgi:hypothetical protein